MTAWKLRSAMCLFKLLLDWFKSGFMEKTASNLTKNSVRFTVEIRLFVQEQECVCDCST